MADKRIIIDIDLEITKYNAKQKEIDRKIRELDDFKKTVSAELNSLLSTLEKKVK